MEFQRLEILLGEDLAKLRNLRILILGIGGVGGYATEALARCGVNHIMIADYDYIDITNINRQIIALTNTVGKLKVDVMKERILAINPNCEVETFPIFYNQDNKDIFFTKKIDYILDCCDSLSSKELIIREAVKRKIKIISSMGAGYKFDPTKIEIAKLKNTSYDKLAKILRNKLKDNKDCLNIKVIYSKETFAKREKVIGSNSFIPSIFGLYMASIVVNDIRKKIT